MTGWEYFYAWWLDGCYDTGTPDDAWLHQPAQVRRAAIAASYDGLYQAAIELKEQAIAIMSQTTRNMNEKARHAEQRMVAIVDGERETDA